MNMTPTEREQFARDNFNLIYAFIDHYHLRYREDDLIDLLYIAYTKAINMYDPTKGTFATIAFECMRREFFKQLYLEKMPKRNTTGLTFVPLDSTVLKGEDSPLAETIADPRVNVEYETLHNMYVSDSFINIINVVVFGKVGIPRLNEHYLMTKKEVRAFLDLYVDKLSVAELANKWHISKQAANNINRDIIRKLYAWFKQHNNRSIINRTFTKYNKIADPMEIGKYIDEVLLDEKRK